MEVRHVLLSMLNHAQRAPSRLTAPSTLHRHARRLRLRLLHQLRLRLRHHLRLLLQHGLLLGQHAALHHHWLRRLRRQVLLLRRLLLQEHWLRLRLHGLLLCIGGGELLLQDRLLRRLDTILLLHWCCRILRLQGLLLRLHGSGRIALALLRLQHARRLLLRAGQQLLRDARLLLQQVLQQSERLLVRARLLQAAHTLGKRGGGAGGGAAQAAGLGHLGVAHGSTAVVAPEALRRPCPATHHDSTVGTSLLVAAIGLQVCREGGSSASGTIGT